MTALRMALSWHFVVLLVVFVIWLAIEVYVWREGR